MRRSLSAFVISWMLATQLSPAAAFGFGRTSNSTVLGQQLDFSIVLTTAPGEALNAECITAEVMVGDNALSPTVVKTRLDTAVDTGNAVLRVVTNVRIEEPIASISVVLSCPTRMTRKFVVFIDPPVVAETPVLSNSNNLASTPAVSNGVAAAKVATYPLISRSSGRSNSQRAARKASASGSKASATRRHAVQNSVLRSVSAVEPQRGRATHRSSSVVLAAGSTAFAAPRLKLEAELPAYKPGAFSASAPAPLDKAALNADSAGASAAFSTAPSFAASATEAQQRQIQLLEQKNQKLANEARVSQTTLATVKARLEKAEAASFPSTWVYFLGALAVLLLGCVIYLFRRQLNLKRDSAWWHAEADVEKTNADKKSAAAGFSSSDPELGLGVDEAPGATTGLSFANTSERVVNELQPQTFVVDPAPVPATDVPRTAIHREPSQAVAEPQLTRDMCVEELIDMEQQAEFFIVLGQDDAAIDLLMGHVRHGGSTSPLAFLKLLEIYKRRNEREAYERIRERFNQRFNAYAPDWEQAASAGQALESYSDAVAQVQAAWPEPLQAMALLESLLFRRDDKTGTFDLPAYGELLFLYSQARDLAENVIAPGAVDVLLPLGEEMEAVTEVPATETVALDSLEPLTRPVSKDKIANNGATIDFNLDLNEPALPARR